MEKFAWYPRLHKPDDPLSNPISGEFFSDNASPALPLVREALQNAIDAGKNVNREGEPIRVRIALSDRKSGRALSAAVADRWFGGLRKHNALKGNGLTDAPGADEPCGFLVVEDFGTSGLTGDIRSYSVGERANNFVDFLKGDGLTRKSSGAQGSWGVGKNVFPRSSRINAYIAFTVRHDDRRRLMMGKSILKIRVLDGEQYRPDSYLAASWDEGQVPYPVEDAGSIDQLINDFGLKRREEPGLSLVMPWVFDSVRPEELLDAVVAEYYYAILAGTLCVTLEAAGEKIELSADSLSGLVADREELSKYAKNIDLASWSQKVQDAERIVLASSPAAGGAQQWIPDLLGEDEKELIKNRLLNQERVALRVPLHIVKSKNNGGGGPVPTYFDVFLESDDELSGETKPVFFREQLCINKVHRVGGAHKVRSLIIIEDEPLATMLRAAEPPNHSDWVAGTSNIKGQYIKGGPVITFVKTAVRSLVGFARASDEKPDATIAIDYFAKPAPEGNAPPKPAQKKKKPGGDPEEQEMPELTPKKKRFNLSQIEGGFRITPGEEGAELPKSISVTMAYDVFSGSPWNLYDTADFDLTKQGITLACSGGANASAAEPNKLKIDIDSSPFEVFVTGFDTNRDLIVQARSSRGVSDGDS